MTKASWNNVFHSNILTFPRSFRGAASGRAKTALTNYFWPKRSMGFIFLRKPEAANLPAIYLEVERRWIRLELDTLRGAGGVNRRASV